MIHRYEARADIVGGECELGVDERLSQLVTLTLTDAGPITRPDGSDYARPDVICPLRVSEARALADPDPARRPGPPPPEADAMSTDTIYQQLRGHLHYLKLAAIAEQLAAALEHADRERPGYSEFLHGLLKTEVDATEQRRLHGRLRFSKLPARKTLAQFDRDAQPSLDARMIDELATLRFIEERANVLLIGPPGVGKTHLAVALGHQAVEAGYRVYYTTAADLVARTSRAVIEGRWQATMRFWNGPQLLLIDELGYLPMPGHDASHLFQVISRRYEHGSIVLTTNRGIADWGAIFEARPSPPRSSTASYTTQPSSRSPATATACAATETPSRRYAQPSQGAHKVGKFPSSQLGNARHP